MDIRAYTDQDGDAPFWDWFERLHDPAKVRVTRAPRQMANGNLSNAKSVGFGVLEFRIDFGPGYRIYFGRDGQEIVLLLTGGDTPAATARYRCGDRILDDLQAGEAVAPNVS